ncbi:hypothetical protein CF15_05895 [Pyrodictium occultum]|uniref:Uncharacterized protein n=1 Tax=Pyrodictium occultum TaxID=2309 RepID=A0A0V8RW86_PYROC|nr:hypothetical protein CF15_05895 [Pyrodictium occultum]
MRVGERAVSSLIYEYVEHALEVSGHTEVGCKWLEVGGGCLSCLGMKLRNRRGRSASNRRQCSKACRHAWDPTNHDYNQARPQGWQSTLPRGAPYSLL